MNEHIEYWPGILLWIALVFGPLVAVKRARKSWKVSAIVSACTCAVLLGLFYVGAALQSPAGYGWSELLRDMARMILMFCVALGLWIAVIVRPLGKRS